MKKDYWILKSFVIAFFIALFFNIISNVIISEFDYLLILILITILFVILNIFFDAVGTSVLTADEATFHAMSSKKIKGAKTGVYLIKNSDRISSIFCDILGDICGIISGGVVTMIAILLAQKYNISSLVTILFISSLVSSITVGGKAIGKKLALKKGDKIVFSLSKFLDKFNKKK